jgi:hypothetical protein
MVSVRARPSLTRRCSGQLISDGPRQEIAHAIDRMVGNARDDVAQISLRIEAVEFGGRDQCVDRGASLATAVRAEEVLAADRSGKQVATGLKVGASPLHCRQGYSLGPSINIHPNGERRPSRWCPLHARRAPHVRQTLVRATASATCAATIVRCN